MRTTPVHEKIGHTEYELYIRHREEGGTEYEPVYTGMHPNRQAATEALFSVLNTHRINRSTGEYLGSIYEGVWEDDSYTDEAIGKVRDAYFDTDGKPNALGEVVDGVVCIDWYED